MDDGAAPAQVGGAPTERTPMTEQNPALELEAKIREKLGWTPKVELLAGLRETIAYFDDQLHRNDFPEIDACQNLIRRAGPASRVLIGA